MEASAESTDVSEAMPFEKQLSEQTRIAIERQVCTNVLESIRQWFPGAI